MRQLMATLVTMAVTASACGGPTTGTSSPAETDQPPASSTAAPLDVQTFADLGSEHVSDEDAAAIIDSGAAGPDYNSVPPTSGPHTSFWARCGVYRQIVPLIVQLHSLEHGAVVIQYGPGSSNSEITILESFARDKASHVVVAPSDDLGERIVATAWTVMLEMPTLDIDSLERFWSDYAQQGPEQVACPVEIDEASG